MIRRTAQSKPSKASLVARGLAAKPLKGKRAVKAKKVPDNNPGYSLYSTDSEDQASNVGRGLDRCATLLTNILDSNSKGQNKLKSVNKQISKVKGKPSTKAPLSKPRPASSVGKPIVIPTASHKDQGPSTLYNERLIASTPLLNTEERKKQQHLLEREQELTRQLHQLKQHYELLQRQKSPEIHEQQKRNLQTSLLNELDDYDRQDKDLVVNSPTQEQKARRSLDYNHIKDASKVDCPESNAQTSTPFTYPQPIIKSKSKQDDSVVKKQVRVISPDPSERYHPSTNVHSNSQSVRVMSPDPSERYHPSSSSPSNRNSKQTLSPDSLSPNTNSEPVGGATRQDVPPCAASNEMRTLQYLMRELTEVLGNHDDLEVNRLLMEIGHTCSILPYLIQSPNKQEDENMANKRLRVENEFLKRKLQSTQETTHYQEEALQRFQQLQSGQASVSFDLAACKTENASLQKQLKDEKDEKEKYCKETQRLEKEQNLSKNRRSSQLETLKLSNEIQQLKAEVAAGKCSLEAAKKEAVIVNLSLKQKDAEIERLNQLTKALNLTMRRALEDIQEYTPNGIKHQPTKDQLTSANISGVASLNENYVMESAQVMDALQDERLSSLFKANVSKSPLIDCHQTSDVRHTSPFGRDVISHNISLEDPVLFSPKAFLGEGVWRERKLTSTTSNDQSLEFSSFSRDEEDFQRDLESLDADIARIQKSLRETAKRGDL